MTFVLRIMTLFTIAAAGFAMPMTCAQRGATTPVDVPVIAVSAAQRLEVPAADHEHSPGDRHAEPMILDRLLERLPFDCGESAPRATEHSATIDAQPFVAGYIGSAPVVDELPPKLVGPSMRPMPIDLRAGPPDAPPPRLAG